MRRSQKKESSLNGKRFFDIFFSLTFLTLFSPLYFVLIFIVKITSKGPIFYKGLRMGKNGKPFFCWKFRTMCMDADRRLHQILHENLELKKEWDTFFKLKKDPRLTIVGKFLRISSLDELPQIWNVLKGELSFVGPRPIAIESIENAEQEIRKHFGEHTDKILSVKPGVTCIWQTRGRNLLTFKQRIDFELEYIDNQSFWLDLKIILNSIPVVLFPKGAF